MPEATATLSIVRFDDETILAVEHAGRQYAVIKPICDRHGLNWSAQRTRITQDPVLKEGVAMIAIPTAGGMQAMLCLQIELVNGWLFGIDSRKVAPKAREGIILYQRKCYAALHAHFHPSAAAGAVKPEAVEADVTLLPLQDKFRLFDRVFRAWGPVTAQLMWHKLGLPTVPSMFHEPSQGSLFKTKAVDMHFDGSEWTVN